MNSELTRDFTATAFVFWRGKVLLHKHKRLGMWLPCGGHIEPNELPDEAAVRDAMGGWIGGFYADFFGVVNLVGLQTNFRRDTYLILDAELRESTSQCFLGSTFTIGRCSVEVINTQIKGTGDRC